MKAYQALIRVLGAETVNVLVGSLLGDAGVRFNAGQTASFIFMQSVGKAAYVAWLLVRLKGAVDPRISTTKPQPSGNVCPHFRWWLPASYEQWSLASLFYVTLPGQVVPSTGLPKRVKTVPWGLLPYMLNWEVIGVWISDDGGKTGAGVILSTENFTRWEVFSLVLALEQHLGLVCSMYTRRRRDGSIIGYRIYIRKESVPLLQANVAQFMDPSMHYKIHL